ncbi:hypothetical protein KCU73_g7334, partial [Aureobasidium melanogenum]
MQSNETLVLEKRAVNYDGVWPAGSGSIFSFSDDRARQLFIPMAGTSKGKSGYPHEYQKRDGFEFPVGDCNDPSVKTLEWPVFQGKDQWIKDTKKKDQPIHSNPGAFRVVYREDNSEFCGYMTHTEKKEDGSAGGRFQLCEEL